MNDLEDEYRRRANTESEKSKASAAKDGSDRAVSERRTLDRCYYERHMLGLLKEKLEPSYAQLRKTPVTLFMFPHLSPLRIEQSDKKSKPVLICDYGKQMKREHGNCAEKLRTKITIGDDNNYIIEEQGWLGISKGPMESPVFDWRHDIDYKRIKGRKNPHSCDLDEAADHMKERILNAYGEHRKLSTGRAGSAIGAGVLALVAMFTLSQCKDANAQGAADPINDADGVELIDTMKQEL